VVNANVCKSVRSGARLLQVLTVLNTLRGAGVLEVARETSLSRATVYRFLETLVQEGYVLRDDEDGLYRPTVKVRSLSDGFDDHVWLAQVGRESLFAAGKELNWPVAIGVPSGAYVAVIRSTDSVSALAVEKRGPGYRRPLLESAAGLCYLAFCRNWEQGEMLKSLCRRTDGAADIARRREIERSVEEIKQAGYALYHRPGRRSDRSALAVPIIVDDAAIGTLTVRYARSAVPDATARASFPSTLARASRNIQAAFISARAHHAKTMPVDDSAKRL
jgi:IclR family mhp operon transcriptional activator